MKIEPRVSTKEARSLLPKFFAITGWAEWEKRVDQVTALIQRKPYLQDYYEGRHGLECELVALQRRARTTGRLPKPESLTPKQVAGLGFAAMAARVHRALPDAGRKRLAGLIRHSLHDHLGLLPLEFEFATASDLMGRGFDVEFHDLEAGGGFDFLLRQNAVQAEAECKTISVDRGRKVHRRDLHKLGDFLFPLLAGQVRGRVLRADVTLIDRLPPDHRGLRGLAREIATQVTLGAGTRTTSLGRLDVRLEKQHPGSPEHVRSLLQAACDEGGRHALGFLSGRGVVALIVGSEKADDLLQGVADELKAAALKQLSGRLPGIIFVQLEGVAHTDWHLLKNESGLRALAEAFFAKPRYSHVHSVVFSSDSDLILQDGGVRQSGTRLVFPNLNGPHIDEPVLHLRGNWAGPDWTS